MARHILEIDTLKFDMSNLPRCLCIFFYIFMKNIKKFRGNSKKMDRINKDIEISEHKSSYITLI
jgi:hypothetical protein